MYIWFQANCSWNLRYPKLRTQVKKPYLVQNNLEDKVLIDPIVKLYKINIDLHVKILYFILLTKPLLILRVLEFQLTYTDYKLIIG
jgi:hypothetical protein